MLCQIDKKIHPIIFFPLSITGLKYFWNALMGKYSNITDLVLPNIKTKSPTDPYDLDKEAEKDYGQKPKTPIIGQKLLIRCMFLMRTVVWQIKANNFQYTSYVSHTFLKIIKNLSYLKGVHKKNIMAPFPNFSCCSPGKEFRKKRF